MALVLVGDVVMVRGVVDNGGHGGWHSFIAAQWVSAMKCKKAEHFSAFPISFFFGVFFIFLCWLTKTLSLRTFPTGKLVYRSQDY